MIARIGDAVQPVSTATERPLGFALSFGLLSGMVLMLTIKLDSPLSFLVACSLLPIIAGVWIRLERVESFRRRFLMLFVSMLVAVTVAIIYVLIERTTPAPLVAFAIVPLGVAATCALVSLAIAQLTATRLEKAGSDATVSEA